VAGAENPLWTSYELYFAKYMPLEFAALATELSSGFFTLDRSWICRPYADLHPRSLTRLLQLLKTIDLPEGFNLNPLLESLSIEQQSANAERQKTQPELDRRQQYRYSYWQDYDRVDSVEYYIRKLRDFIQKEMAEVLSVPEKAVPLKEKIAQILFNPNVYFILSTCVSLLQNQGENNNLINVILQLAELDRNQLLDLKAKLEFYHCYIPAVKQQTISIQQMLALPKISSMDQELRNQLQRLLIYTIEYEELVQILSGTNRLLVLQIYNPLVALNPNNALHLAQIRQQLTGLTKDQLLELQAKLQLHPLLALGFATQMISLEQMQALPKVSEMHPGLIAALQKPWVQEAWKRKLIDITYFIKLAEPRHIERIITLGNLPAEECFKQLERRKVLHFLAGFHPRAGRQSPLRQVHNGPIFERRLLPGLRKFLDAKLVVPATLTNADDDLEISGTNYPVGGNSAGFWPTSSAQSSSTSADAKLSSGFESAVSLDDADQGPRDSGPEPAYSPSANKR